MALAPKQLEDAPSSSYMLILQQICGHAQGPLEGINESLAPDGLFHILAACCEVDPRRRPASSHVKQQIVALPGVCTRPTDALVGFTSGVPPPAGQPQQPTGITSRLRSLRALVAPPAEEGEKMRARRERFRAAKSLSAEEEERRRARKASLKASDFGMTSRELATKDGPGREVTRRRRSKLGSLLSLRRGSSELSAQSQGATSE